MSTIPAAVDTGPPRTGGTVADAAIGAAIRERRNTKNMLMEDLARRSGVGFKVLSRIERGERPCRVPEMVAVARILRIAPQKLLRRAAQIQDAEAATRQDS